MKVKDIIAELKKCDPEMEGCVAEDSLCKNITRVYTTLVDNRFFNSDIDAENVSSEDTIVVMETNVIW